MDDEEQHLDRLEDRDYEGGQWIGGEYFYQNKKQKRQRTKDDSLYGVFGESDSDEEYRSKKGDRDGGRKDYTKPVGFVSKGIVNQKQQDEEDGKEPDTKPFDVQGPPGQEGSNGLIGGGGLGFKSGSQQGGAGGTAQEEEGDDGVLSTALGSKIKQRVAERLKAEKQERQAEKQRQESGAGSIDPKFGNFEKHTKGIGMKLLMKMGYKPGEGLGKDKAGAAKPIEVTVRQKNQALGFGVRHHEEKEKELERRAAVKVKSEIRMGEEELEGATAEADTVPGGQPDQANKKGWKKKHQEVRSKREYRTAEDVVQEASDRPHSISSQPILDMRGPQVRLITNLEHLNVQEEAQAEGDKVPMAELQHNLKLLVDLCEADIQKLDARLRHEQDTVTLVSRDKDRLEQEEQQQQLEVKRLEQVMEMVQRCQEADRNAGQEGLGKCGGAPAPMSLEEIEAVYLELSRSYREEYVMYSLAAVALSQVLPRMQALLRGWVPLSEPGRGVDQFRRWRPLLESPGARGPFSVTGASEDAYLTLVTEFVLPPLRSACTNWEPREPEPLLSFLDTWESLLPPAALSHILDMLVMPRIRRAVEGWEPRQETVPIHSWLHPWLPYLGLQLEELYPGIRHKLAVALQAWHPSDGSALVLLKPWHKVFSSGDWEALMLKSIVPKLAYALQQLVIDPSAQDMSPFLWLTSWSEVMPLMHFISLMEHGFFPKWHQVLHYWLSHSPNYDEVTRWYLGWKSYFPAQVLDHERVRHQFNMALDAMNSAVEGGPPMASSASGSQGGGSVPFATRWATDGAAPLAAPSVPSSGMAASDMTLKDLVQRFAEEHSVSFMPKFGRFQDGLQVYSFAGISIVLENTTSVIRAQLRDRWAPVSLETLLQQSKLLA